MQRRENMKYQWIAMDMDGTLCNSKKEISPRTKEILWKAQEMGMHLILASGRPTAGLLKQAKELKMDQYGGYLLAFNGARITSYPEQKVLYNHTIPKKYILPILNNAKALNMSVMIHDGEDVVVEDANCYKAEYEAFLTNMKIKVVDALKEYLTFEPNKFLISAPEEYMKQVMEDFKCPFQDLLSISTSAPFYLEVMNQGIDKGASLKRLAEIMQMDKEAIIAFGDEMNDLTMLQYVGHGVAMGNAVKPVQRIAKEITKSNDEDGIAVTLERILSEMK